MSNTDRTSGLQRILKQIEADGLETINKFDRETNDELKKRQTEIIADAQARATEIISAAKKRAAQTAENTKTGTEARIKKYILSAQSEILDECINLGITRIKHMPDEKYFDLIEKLIIKYSDKGINTLLLSDADIKRMPTSFVNNINKTLAQKGASLTLSDERIDTEGGFIIRKNGKIDGVESSPEYCIEENCTFDAMIKDNIEVIRDELYKKLKTQGVLR